MADLTYQQVIDQIASRLNRDDLQPDIYGVFVISNFVQDRINYYAKEYFYNAQFVDRSITTVQGQGWYDLPAGWQDIHFVRINQGGVWIPLSRYWHFTDILTEDVLEPPTQSLPSNYTIYQNPTPGHEGKMAIRLFPVPYAAFNLELVMDGPPRAPQNGSDTNFWTQDAQTLTIEATCEAICSLYLNDPIRAGNHRKAKEDEENSLGSKSIRIRAGIHVRPHL